MSGYKINFNGLDRLYDAYSWRLSRRAKQAWKTGTVVTGRYLKEFEIKIAEKAFRKFGIGVGSATDGLYFAMKAVGLDNTSTIICPVLSFKATAGAIKRLGAKIIYIDVDQFGNLGSLKGIGKVDAVVYVHLYGNPSDYYRIKNFCDSQNIPLIEDAAQSQGAWYHGVPSGKLGNVSVYSFAPTKNLPCFGTGGMVLTDSYKIYKKVLDLRKHGGESYDYGYNSLISEDHANQMIFLLEKFDELQKMREKIYKRYQKNLSNLNFLIQSEQSVFSSYHKCVLLCNERDKLQDFLKNNGIETMIHYSYLLDKDLTNHYPVAETIQAQCLSLPIYPFLEEKEVDYICNKINYFYGV
jgi:dTDP-4-amino-4,6-dideoxygalactose transaminase